MKKISIITINYNNREGLERTLDSIHRQTYTNYEQAVIDGASTDGSAEIIGEHGERFSYWVSEKDRGIYHAMNKGILQAKGEYLLFLNSGDWLAADDTLEKVAPLLESGEDIVCGNIIYEKDGREKSVGTPPSTVEQLYLCSPFLSLPHQSSFIKRNLFDNNLYNENNRIVSDWEFFLRCFIRKNCTYKRIPLTIVFFDTTGISSNPENRKLIEKEQQEVLGTIFPPSTVPELQRIASIAYSPFGEIIPLFSHRQHFQRRMKKLVLFCLAVHTFFSKRK